MKLVNSILILGVLILGSSCKSEDPQVSSSSGQKSLVDMNMGSYTTASNSVPLLDFIIPSAYAAISDLRFCFKRVRFKRADEDTLDALGSEDNVDFEIGEVILDNTGVLLGRVEVPEATYKRIEFDLEDNCGTGHSVELMNDNGSFSSSDRITVKFRGQFTADQASENLTLGVQSIMDALNTHTTGDDLKDTLESASGTL